MKQFVIALCIILAVDYFLPSCANPKAPTGGPKDTIPPTFVQAFPPNQTLLFQGSSIELEFDEFVDATKLKDNLIITPQIDIDYKATTKRNRLILKFEEPFPDSTTITLNFFDGLTDITENNPAVNLNYVFSTGDFLDSLEISGTLSDLMTDEPNEKYLVALYPYSDTLDLQIDQPLYFTTSNEEGQFIIRNIKNAHYKLLAFNDGNRNLQFEGAAESHGFLSGIIQLDSNVSNLQIKTLKQNVSELKLLSSRALGNYFDIRYSKGLDSIAINEGLDYNFMTETNTLRIYKPQEFDLADSLQTIITAKDSTAEISIDTLFIKFNENVRKKEALTNSITPEDNQIKPLTTFSLRFNKPIGVVDTSLIRFVKDSTFSFPIDTLFSFNSNRTQFDFTQLFDTTSYFQIQRDLIAQAQDTTIADTTATRPKSQSSSISRTLTLKMESGAFISVANDTLPVFEKQYSFLDAKSTGTINLTVNTQYPAYTIQLMDKQYNVLQEYPGKESLTLKQLSPGDYGIRILIDANEDGVWSLGNLIRDIEPEPVYIYPDFTSLRANWDINIDVSF